MPHRERIATAMALIAIFGAVTTFRASQNELIASGCARRHAIAATYFDYRKEYYANKLDANSEYEDDYRIHIARARRYLRTALLRLPAVAPDKAFFQVEAQLEFAAARQLKPLERFTDVAYQDNLSVDDNLNKFADGDMRTAGLGGGCIIGAHHDAHATALSMLESDTGAVRWRAIRCAFTVVLFVLALVFLTLSEVVPQRFKHASEIAGYTVAVFAVIFSIVWADGALAQFYALAIGIFAFVGAAGWLGLRLYEKRRRTASTPSSEPAETETLRYEEFDTEGFRAKHLHLFEPRTLFSRLLVIAIAVAAFLSSIAGLSYSYAIATADGAAMQANAHQAAILSTYAHEATKMHFAMREMNIGMESDLREASLNVLDYGLARYFGRTDVAPWLYEAAQWKNAFGELSASDSTTLRRFVDRSDGPYLDVRYPYSMYYGSVATAPARELALADAYDEDASTYERGATYCLTMLTVLAIALYLFGQALAMGTSDGARLLGLFGGALIVAGIAVGVVAIHVTRTSNGDKAAFNAACPRPTDGPAVATRAQVAASCYAQGEYAREVANDRESYKPAMDSFQRAANLRPDFALAQYRLLSVEDEYATPQRTGYTSIEDPEELTRLVQDRQAVSAALSEREFSPPANFESDAAFDTYIQSLIKRDRSMLRSSIDLARSDPDATDDPGAQYDIGLMLLADNNIAQARKVYVAGMRSKPQDSEADISSISDLELLRTQCPSLPWHTAASCGDLAQAAAALKTQLLQNGFSRPVVRPQHAAALDVRAWVEPDGVAWSAPANQLQQIHGKIGVIWYLKDPTWKSWYAHLGLMHHTNLGSLTRQGDRLVEYFSYLSDSDFVRCLPTRQDFRLELYANGQLIGSSRTIPGRPDDLDFTGGRFGTADIGFCYPKARGPKLTWRRAPSLDGYPEGVYVDPLKKYTIHAFVIFAPKKPTQASADRFLLGMITNFLPILNVRGLHPAPLDCPPPVNPLHAVHIHAVARDNTVQGKAWATPDGLLHFVLVRHALAPGARADPTACEILNSAQPIYPDMY